MILTTNDKTIKELILVVPLSTWRRYDIFPFFALYVIVIANLIQVSLYHDDEWKLLYAGIFATCSVISHIVTLLFGFWNHRIRIITRYRYARSLNDATHIFVFPAPHCGTADVVSLNYSDNKTEGVNKKSNIIDTSIPICWFTFQQKKMIIDTKSHSVTELDFPINLQLGNYLSCTGHASAEEENLARLKWGLNDFHIPIPQLEALLLEHALAPFFLFQIFCVLLWCLDEYWYYALLTLVMLIMFEVTVCKQRQQNMTILRSMRRPPFPICVFRAARWQMVSSTQLLPGDICSIRFHHEGDTMFSNFQHRERREVLVPCDMILLRGTCIVNEAMLTGESIPKMKEALNTTIAAEPALAKEMLSLETHTNAFIFGGTKVMQHTPPEKSQSIVGIEAIPQPPDHGCIAVVVRTGFYSGQGSLMRTILYSQERVTLDNSESYAFIGILLIFAIVAACFVLYQGLQNETQSRWKLLLHCIMIITSVVPPELPMELTLAVNTSLTRLYQLAIFCTESYRIPWAGKLDVCCFDKTGTLTSDDYVLRGVALDLTDAKPKLVKPTDLPRETITVLASCHQLVRIYDSVEGDAIELATLHAIGWGITKAGKLIDAHDKSHKLEIVHRFPFSSTLKRMSTVITSSEREGFTVVCKGAPEVLEKFFVSVPDGYQQGYEHFMKSGKRVLALGYKYVSSVKSITRESAESDLHFAGILVLESPMKDDTAVAVRLLQTSGHKVVVITGDNALTACNVAGELGILQFQGNHDKTLIFELNATNTPQWVSIGQHSQAKTTRADMNFAKLAEDHDLVVTGPVLALQESQLSPEAYLQYLETLVPYVKVFARVSPKHKEMIMASMKNAGLYTLFCGDGTNDVGGLKQAHIGISIINSPELERMMASARQKRLPAGASLTERLMHEMDEIERQGGGGLVQLGDASMASPFTSKTPSIMAVVHVIRQGRCTLVTTIQMYKMLALNCLLSAYSLSVLYLHGVKQGDTQSTIAGLLIAVLFMCISWAKPVDDLAPERPVANVFSTSVAMSLLGQLVVHFGTLLSAVYMTEPFVEENVHPDDDFSPNVMNSMIFVLTLCMQCNVFGVNYRGRPFMQSLREHKPFAKLLGFVWVLSFVLALDVSDTLREQFELVEFPVKDDYNSKVLSLMLVDTLGSWGWEYWARKTFA